MRGLSVHLQASGYYREYLLLSHGARQPVSRRRRFVNNPIMVPAGGLEGGRIDVSITNLSVLRRGCLSDDSEYYSGISAYLSELWNYQNDGRLDERTDSTAGG